MKTLKLFILCLAIFLNYNVNAQVCNTSDLDKNIDKLIPKAKKNKLNEKQLVLLTQSYHQANECDHKRIMELKSSGQPDIWIEIYHKVNNINERQNKINTLPNNIKNAMNFKALNLDNEISNSKEKAELYICAKSNLLLKNPNNENLKEVSSLVNQLRKINPKSGNIEDLILKSVIMSSKRIVFRVATPTNMHFPQELAKIILDFEENTIYGVPFDVLPEKNTEYDLMIRIMIDEKSISPEKVETITFEERKDDLKAIVTDKTMIKSATLKGKIQFIDVENDVILINTPYDISSTFYHKHAEISGNEAACSEYTLQLSNTEVIDFPSDELLLTDVSHKLNLLLKNYYQKK